MRTLFHLILVDFGSFPGNELKHEKKNLGNIDLCGSNAPKINEKALRIHENELIKVKNILFSKLYQLTVFSTRYFLPNPVFLTNGKSNNRVTLQFWEFCYIVYSTKK